MKIADSSANPVGSSTTPVGAGQAGSTRGQPSASQTAAAAGTASAAPEASAQLELSSAAATLVAGNTDEGSFDAEKVQRISQAIADGKFTVNADAIADKLISNAQEQLGRNSQH